MDTQTPSYLVRIPAGPSVDGRWLTLCEVQGIDPLLEVVRMLFASGRSDISFLGLEILSRPKSANPN